VKTVAFIWQDEGMQVASMPIMDGSTCCGLDEDIVEYIVDWFWCVGAKVVATRDSETLVSIEIVGKVHHE
jgi:hypothetical protein